MVELILTGYGLFSPTVRFSCQGLCDVAMYAEMLASLTTVLIVTLTPTSVLSLIYSGAINIATT